eukprot:gene36722-44545_t
MVSFVGMKRGAEDAGLDELSRCSSLFAKVSRIHYDTRSLGRSTRDADECLDAFLQGMHGPAHRVEDFGPLNDFMQSDDFWDSILSMEQKSSEKPQLTSIIGFDTLRGDCDAVLAHMATSPLPLVLTSATAPFAIVAINTPWTDMCEYKQEEVQGKTLKLIQGPLTSPAILQGIKEGLSKNKCVSTCVVNYTKSKVPFLNKLRIRPVKNSEGEITHYLGLATWQGKVVVGENQVPPTV